MAPNRIDVEKSASHHQSHHEIAGDNPCSQHLSGNTLVSDYGVNQELADMAMGLCKWFPGSATMLLLPPRPRRQSPRRPLLRFLCLRHIHEVPTPPR